MSYMRIVFVFPFFFFFGGNGWLFLLVWMESKTSTKRRRQKKEIRILISKNLSASLSLNDPIYSAATMISKSLKNPYPPYTDQILLTRAVSTDHSPISYLLTSRCYYIKLRVWISS